MDQPTLPAIPLGTQAVYLQALTSRSGVAGWQWARAGAARGPCGAPPPWSGGMHVNFSDSHPFPGC